MLRQTSTYVNTIWLGTLPRRTAAASFAGRSALWYLRRRAARERESGSVTPPRLFVVGDIAGPDDYHLGDEAMLEANLAALRRVAPGVRFTVTSRDPACTAVRYAVDAVPAPVVPPSLLAEPGRWRDALVEAPAPRRQWLGETLVAAIGASDGLVFSGGGNLCASWPEKILERVALIAEARTQGLPVAIVGQTLGPTLRPVQRDLLANALSWASVVRVRDAESAALATELGVPGERLGVQLDDAFCLPPAAVTDARAAAWHALPRPWVVITLDASFGLEENADALAAIASQLDGLAEHLHASLLFSPHVGGARVAPVHADPIAGRRLADHLRAPLVVLDLWQPREVRWLIGEAAMVVSSRYHPLVFATAAGVPALGIHGDAYTRRKLRGALVPAGVDGWCLAKADAARGALLPLAAELAHRHASVRHRMTARAVTAGAEETRRWQEVLAALQLAEPVAAAVPPPAVTIDACAEGEPARSFPGPSDDAWQRYERQGYLRLGRVLDEAAVGALRERLDAIMLGHVRLPTLQTQLDTGGAYDALPAAVAGPTTATLGYRKVQGLETDPLFLALLRHDLFRAVCARHYGPHAAVAIFRAMMMNKPAAQGTYLPWHQDGGDVWKLDRDPLVTIWVALDPATRANGCVEVIPGSHRLGLLSKFGSTLAPRHVDAHCPAAAVEPLELAAGEALLLHNWLVHRSGVNPTPTPRRAFTACYMDARTLGTLTGERYPLVFGEPENLDAAMPFLGALREENRRLREMRAEAEGYARALEADLARVRAGGAPPTPSVRPWWWPRR